VTAPNRLRAAGFSLVETLIGMAVLLSATAIALGALIPALDAFVTQPEVADMQQRVRVAVDRVGRDLVMAGAGSGHADGALYYYVAPVRPHRIGDVRSDAAAGVHYRPDSISVQYVPIEKEATARESSVGDRRVAVVTHTYYLKSAPRSGLFQLMHYDGRSTDLPLIDDVIGLQFDYMGDSRPPRIARAALDDGSPPRASYGPSPPRVGIDNPADTWGPGENCTFMVGGEEHISRLAVLSETATLQPLPPAMLVDGPWCPDASAAEPFDADLLRIRRVLVRMRFQARAMFRGPAGPLFRVSGTATALARHVPDQEIRFDVAPRNMNLAR
jgi:hypothetical protein